MSDVLTIEKMVVGITAVFGVGLTKHGSFCSGDKAQVVGVKLNQPERGLLAS